MPKFDKKSTAELNECLYNSFIHDAKLESIEYMWEKDIVKIGLFNPIFGVNINLVFHRIRLMLAIKGELYGSRDTIISLTVEKDISYLKTYLPNYNECSEDSVYLLFQMFSGEELHIVSKEVDIHCAR